MDCVMRPSWIPRGTSHLSAAKSEEKDQLPYLKNTSASTTGFSFIFLGAKGDWESGDEQERKRELVVRKN